MMKRLKNNRGLTLLEVVIALGIMAVMGVMISETTDSLIQGKGFAEKQAQRKRLVQVSLMRIFDDVQMAFLSDRSFAGRNNSYQTGFDGDEESVNFSTMSHLHYIKNKPETDQVHVGYSLEKDEKGDYALYRRETDRLMEDLEKGGQSFLLLKGIKSMTWEYFDSNRQGWGKVWNTDSVVYANRLPQIVRVSMTVYGQEKLDGSRYEYDYQLDIPVRLYNNRVNF
jgi:general secretion pathway protein J